jgi:hypothetical protein
MCVSRECLINVVKKARPPPTKSLLNRIPDYPPSTVLATQYITSSLIPPLSNTINIGAIYICSFLLVCVRDSFYEDIFCRNAKKNCNMRLLRSLSLSACVFQLSVRM